MIDMPFPRSLGDNIRTDFVGTINENNLAAYSILI